MQGCFVIEYTSFKKKFPRSLLHEAKLPLFPTFWNGIFSYALDPLCAYIQQKSHRTLAVECFKQTDPLFPIIQGNTQSLRHSTARV